jgi:hypothetical protein
MAIQSDIIGPLRDNFSKAQEVFVLLPQNAGQEMVAAASGLAASLKNSGKNVTLACPTPISHTAQTIPGATAITNTIGNRNLIISIKVDKRDSIDKVSYNLNEEEKIFNLVVQPKRGELPLKKDAVSFTYSGSQADLVFLVGVNRFEDLGHFYESEKALFSDAKTVCVSRFATTPFADFHISDTQVSSLAELSLELLETLGSSPSSEAATAFLIGIDTATQNLQSPTVTADTFEKVANLLRAGGVRQSLRPPVAPAPVVGPSSAPVSVPPTLPANQPVPQDWLSPKIYKSPASLNA